MSQGALHELRPRTATELYDAALHLCVHTKSELPVLSLLGAAPLCASGIWLTWQATRGQGILWGSALVVLALVFRQLCQGAGGLAATRELEGHPISAGAALRAAGARLPSMVTCTFWLAVFQWVVFPLTLGFSIFFLSAPLVGPLLIADGSAHGWNFGRVARARLKGRTGAAAVLRIQNAVALVFVIANLHGLIWLGLKTAHALFGLDATFVDQFTSLSHAFYDVCLFALAQLLLDPVRCATGALLLADARVRHEGFDLLAALQRLRDSAAARAAAVLLAFAFALSPRPAHAQSASPPSIDQREDPVEALGSIIDELDEADDAELRRGLARAQGLSRAERAKLVPLVRRLDRLLDDDDDLAADAILRAAFAEAERVPRASSAQRAVQADPRAAAQRILARPEFQVAPLHDHAAAADAVEGPTVPPSWWTRFWKWVGRMLKKLFDREHAHQPVEPAGGLAINGSAAELITYALAALAACVVVILAFRLLTQRKPGEPAAGSAAGGAAPGAPEEMNALAKPAWVWSSQADELAAAGRFREAIRSLYLALLAALHRRGAIDYHPALSNWDYCDGFRGQAGELQPFRELTSRFDFGWYGRLGADAEGYRAFKLLCAPFLGSADPSEASHA